MNVTASAPGKLFLLGEYSVLAGGSALLTAVDRRAQVSIRPSGVTRVRAKTDVERVTSVEQTPIVAFTIDTLRRRGLLADDPLAGHEIELDTSAFFASGRKLGLGSSAALMVAVLRALSPENPPGEDLLEIARECHREFQGGLGSGADVAVSLLGGCIRFNGQGFPSRVVLPHNLHMLFIWTGQAASTPGYLERLNEWRARDPVSADDCLARLGRVADAGISVLQDRQTEAFIDKVHEFNDGLLGLSTASGLDFYTPVHRSLGKLVEDRGLAYKPSGAGGGDFGVAFALDADEAGALDGFLRGKGYFTLLHGESGRASDVCFEE